MITIYGASWCVWCHRARELAEKRSLAFKWYDVDEGTNQADLDARKPEDATTIPQIWWDDRYIGGYSDFAAEVENTIGGYGDGKI